LSGKGKVDLLLEFLIGRQEFDEVVGDGFIGWTVGKRETNGKEGFAITEGGGEDFDDSLVRDFITVQFGGKKFLDAKSKVALDFLGRLSIMIPCRTHNSSS
jgi:hypothetical protein